MKSNRSYSPETPNLGQIWRFLEPCDLHIWRMTLKNNRAPLLSNIKLYASFHHHMWIQKSYSPETVKLGCDLCDLDLWPWPFAWTLLWSLVITPENFMMIRWWEHSQKGVTDTCSQLKTIGHFFYATSSILYHFVPIGEFKFELQSRNAQFGSNSTIFRAVRPWNLTYDLEKQ